MNTQIWFAIGVALGVLLKIALEKFMEVMVAPDPADIAERDAEELLKQAAKEQKQTLRRINKPKYQQPLNQPTENS